MLPPPEGPGPGGRVRLIRATLVVGARPNLVKASALLPALREAGFRVRFLHTGQHRGARMSGGLLGDLGLPRPDRSLGAGPDAARILEGVEDDLRRFRPAVLVVLGDVTSTMAAALAGARAGVPVAHAEAGMRSFDRRMLEEAHRIVTDAVSGFLFTSYVRDDLNLRREGARGRRFRSGDLMADTVLRMSRGRRKGGYGLVTLHRPENVDRPARLKALLAGLGRTARRLPLVFPVHPRTRRRLQGLRIPPGIRLLPPLGYRRFLFLLEGAGRVITDSGGVHLEAAALGVPCRLLRRGSERPARLRGRWDGRAAGRIARALGRALGA